MKEGCKGKAMRCWALGRGWSTTGVMIKLRMNAPATLTLLPPVSIEPGTAVGFKEWALVWESMLRGETSVLFRKGGIAEGRQGFRFKHAEFFLFPTFFHEQVQSLRIAESTTLQEQPASVTIQAWAKVEFTVWVD